MFDGHKLGTELGLELAVSDGPELGWDDKLGAAEAVPEGLLEGQLLNDGLMLGWRLGDTLGSTEGVRLGRIEGQTESEGEVLGDDVASSARVSFAKMLLCSISIIGPFLLNPCRD